MIYESRVGRWKGDGGRGMRYRELGHEAVCTLYTREEDAIVGFYLVLWPVLGINADVNDRGGRSKLSSTGHEVVLTVDLEHPWPTRGRTHRGDLPVIAKFTTGRTERGSEGGLETIQVSRFGGCWCTSSAVNVKPSSQSSGKPTSDFMRFCAADALRRNCWTFQTLPRDSERFHKIAFSIKAIP